MVSAPFDYVATDSYHGAVDLLVQYGEDAKILAGGQSLGPMLNLRLARPTVVIDINGVPTVEPVIEDGMLRLSALTRHRTLIDHMTVRTSCPLLSQVATHIGNVRVRNRGTIGGSLAHCDPTAELGIAALALDAEVVVLGERGPRTIPATDLFVTYLTTSLEPTEVITDVVVPLPAGQHGWGFHEMVRRTSDFAIVAVAAMVELAPQSDTVRSAHVAIAGVSDRVVAAAPEQLAELLQGSATDEAIGVVADQVAAGADPDSDVHASGAYRKRVVGVLTRRALQDAVARARGAEAP